MRVGKVVDNPFRQGATMTLWYGVDALFKHFRLGAADKPRFHTIEELGGVEKLKEEDQEMITERVEAEEAFRVRLRRRFAGVRGAVFAAE